MSDLTENNCDIQRRERSRRRLIGFSAGSKNQQNDNLVHKTDYTFKVLILGDSVVGKTSFLSRYADDSFSPTFIATVGLDYKVKTLLRENSLVQLQIWDTAGQERFKSITTAYYRGALGFILMYDVTRQDTFDAITEWCTQINMNSWDEAQTILVGNKCDLPEERVVTTAKGKALAAKLGYDFFETSAKEDVNVDAVFEKLVDAMCEKMSRDNVANSKTKLLGEDSGTESKFCGC